MTMAFYRRNYIEGLFLSSAVVGSPDATCERMLAVLKTLREQCRFGGYVHVKAIPGASPELTYQLGLYADRMSVNIELPSQQSLKLLAPQKSKEKILSPMGLIRDSIQENSHAPFHLPPRAPVRPCGAVHPDDCGRHPGKRPADSPPDRGAVSQVRAEAGVLLRLYARGQRQEPARFGHAPRLCCGSTGCIRRTGCCGSTAFPPGRF